jgi:acetyl-CoA carboxylase biotin carboxyl carrier protein
VNRVLDFMAQHSLEEFEFASGDLRVHLRKPGSGGGAVIPFATPAAPVAVPGAAPGSAPAVVAGAGATAAAEAGLDEGLHTVKSPIVGTFYGAPNPSAPPFVKVGDKVSAGQVLCIVEAMKLMNEIESDVAGELVRVLVENGQPVEYGQALFAIRAVKS